MQQGTSTTCGCTWRGGTSLARVIGVSSVVNTAKPKLISQHIIKKGTLLSFSKLALVWSIEING